MFATGDRVVYPIHGGAIVKDIEAHMQDGEKVEFEVTDGEKGPQAAKVVKVS